MDIQWCRLQDGKNQPTGAVREDRRVRDWRSVMNLRAPWWTGSTREWGPWDETCRWKTSSSLLSLSSEAWRQQQQVFSGLKEWKTCSEGQNLLWGTMSMTLHMSRYLHHLYKFFLVCCEGDVWQWEKISFPSVEILRLNLSQQEQIISIIRWIYTYLELSNSVVHL